MRGRMGLGMRVIHSKYQINYDTTGAVYVCVKLVKQTPAWPRRQHEVFSPAACERTSPWQPLLDDATWAAASSMPGTVAGPDAILTTPVAGSLVCSTCRQFALRVSRRFTRLFRSSMPCSLHFSTACTFLWLANALRAGPLARSLLSFARQWVAGQLPCQMAHRIV